MKNKITVTIARLYGSGGREIGEKVAEKLGIEFYDKQLIEMAMQKAGLGIEAAQKADEIASSSLLYSIAMSHGSNTMTNLLTNDKLFIAQSEVIRNIANNKSSVIIGRCSNYILAQEKNLLRVFIYADLDSRIERVCRRHEIDRKKAEDLIAKTDKKRANYYNFYTGEKWGKFENYDLLINSTLLGIDGTAEMIADFARKMSEKS